MREAAIKLVDLPRPQPFELTAQERGEIEHALTHYPDSRAASIEALKIVQKHRGWVPDGAIAPVAALIGMGAAELEGVATFYSLIFRQPVGKPVIKLCDSLSCMLTGYEDIKSALEKKIAIRHGHATAEPHF